MLNAIQKSIMDAYLKYPLEDIENVHLDTAIQAFQVLLGQKDRESFNSLFKYYQIVDAIDEIRRILEHPYPQNRSTGSPYVGQEAGYVVWEPDGHGRGIAKEPVGLLSLTARNDGITEPVTREDVTSYIYTQVRSKLANVRCRQEFLFKCEQGDIAYVEEKLAAGMHPDSGSACMRPLLLATTAGNLDLMEILLKAGANVNYRSTLPGGNEKGGSALHIACRAGNQKALELLMSYKADINLLTQGKYSPLALTVIHKQREIFEILLEKKAKLIIPKEKESLLQLALESGVEEFIAILMKKFDDQGLVTPWIIAAQFVLAVRDNNVSLVRNLLAELSMDINTLRWGPFPMIHLAAQQDNLTMLLFLCKNGAHIDKRDSKNNEIILMQAVKHNALRVIAFLMDLMESHNFPQETHLNQAMIYAIGSGHLEALKLLVYAGADVNHCTSSAGCGDPRMSMLTWALSRKENAMVDFLLSSGAKTHTMINVRSAHSTSVELRKEKNPVHLFLSEGNLQSALFWVKKDPVQLLVENEYYRGKTPVQVWMLLHLANTKEQYSLNLMLVFALMAKDLPSSKSLIEHGADSNFSTGQGWSLLPGWLE